MTPVRAKRAGKKPRKFVPVIDEDVELNDRTLRSWLASADDLVIQRPVMPPRMRARAQIPLSDYLRMPSSVNAIENPTVGARLMDSFKDACENPVVVDEAGHTPAEIEMELGGDAGWSVVLQRNTALARQDLLAHVRHFVHFACFRDIDEGLQVSLEEQRREEYDSMLVGEEGQSRVCMAE